MAEVTLEAIRNLLNPLRRRYVVFFHEDDRGVVAEACRALRGEGYEIAERQHPYMKPGIAVAIDADELQPGAWKARITWPSFSADNGSRSDRALTSENADDGTMER